jgi:hypothetical protein
MFFEAHLTEDSDSPVQMGWYYSSHARQEDGTWEEHEGGLYWGYSNATDLEHVIDDTVPFGEFASHQIEYAMFEEICLENNKEAERELLGKFGVAKANEPEKRSYKVRITETLERVVEVKGKSREAAVESVRAKWNGGEHVLGSDDFAGVTFRPTLNARSRDTR